MHEDRITCAQLSQLMEARDKRAAHAAGSQLAIRTPHPGSGLRQVKE